jgi:hypothetical protein
VRRLAAEMLKARRLAAEVLKAWRPAAEMLKARRPAGGGAQAAKGERALCGMVASRAEGMDGGQDSTKGTRRSKVGRRKRKVRRF